MRLMMVIALLCVGAPSIAETGEAVTERSIVTNLRSAAEAGDVDARFQLGRLYERGRDGLEVDLAEATRWYRRAADAGHVDAQRRLGEMSLRGEGVPQSWEQARQYFFLASQAGDTESQYQLGVLFLSGRGVPKVVDEAIGWLTRAAESDHRGAQVALGIVFTDGEQVEPDYDRGLRWLRLASRAGSGEATYRLGLLMEAGTGVPRSFVRAERMFLEAADAGHVPAQLWLGRWYSTDDHRDITKSLTYYRMASGAGDAGGDVGIARLHLFQEVAHPNARLAMSHLRKAVSAGNPEAHHLMALLIGDGAVDGTERTALEHLRYAATNGHVEAQFDLGAVLYKGSSVVGADPVTASTWWARAARSGSVRAQYAYGVLLLSGRSVDRNQGVGYALVNLAAAQGHAEAIQMREQLLRTLDESLLSEAQQLSLTLFDRYVRASSASIRDNLK